MARVTLSQPGEDVIVGGADVQVIGTAAANEIITVVSGNIRLDPSFNQGGDTVVLPGAASSYTAYRSGGEVIFTRNDGAVTLRIPVGAVGTEIQFDGGDSRTLLFNSSTGTATLEGQTLSSSSTSQTVLTGSGPAPLVGYDVANTATSVAEGDSGTRQLVYTITLDRAVTAQDGPLTLNYATSNGTADSATDYVAAAGTVTFAVGQSVATVTVFVNGDTVPEANETVNLTLTGAGLRNGAEVLVGTIINDDVAVSLTGNPDNLQGSSGNDGFFAANTGLGAGDKISDASTTDTDTFSLAVDRTTTNRNFGGFALTNIENVEVTNDSGAAVVLDLSSSTGIKQVSSVNSSSTVIFDQLTSLATVAVDNVTGATADVQAFYQANLVSGANTAVGVVVDNSTANQIFLGTVGGSTTGIETVNLTARGTSVIGGLVTQLTTLNISGGGDVTLNGPLVNTVRTIDASTAGRVTVDFTNNDFAGTGVRFTGSAGADVVRSGLAADNITANGGADTITDEGGNDTISGGAGNDTINLLGAGNVTIDAGADSDTVTFAASQFSSADTVNLGDGADTLVVNQVISEVDFTNTSNAETLTQTGNFNVNLDSDGLTASVAQAAGIRTVNLNVTGASANDRLTATDYTVGLTVNLGSAGGEETVQLGSGNDTINTGSLSAGDVLQGNAGVDTLNVTNAAFLPSTQISGIEVVNFASPNLGFATGTFFVLSDANAPTTGNVLTVNAGTYAANEFFDIRNLGVTAFSTSVTTGAGNDTVLFNNTVADTVVSGAGADFVRVGGGDNATLGAGNDIGEAYDGNNVVNGGDDNDTLRLFGVGNNVLNGDAGSDAFEIYNAANFTAADTLSGGAGADVIRLAPGTYTDAQFTNTTGIETLETFFGAANITIGLEAQDGGAGINTVNLNDAAGADTLNAGAYTTALTVNSFGGNDVITTGIGADTINLAGTGSVNLNSGDGNDRIRVSGTVALDGSDTIVGGLGDDTIELDNTSGTVAGTVNLTNVSVDNYAILSNGLVGGVSQTNSNTLTFTQSTPDVVTSVTPVNISAAALTDSLDSLTVVIANSVTDSDFTFNVTGSSTTTTVDKQNFGINNNINFTGGSGTDILRVAGADAGSTVNFNGGGGTDQLIQVGGSILTDDGFIGLSSVEVLGADTAINAVLGQRAAIAGINTIAGTNNNDLLTVGAGFFNALTINLNGGNDNVNGAATAAALTFAATAGNFTSADVLSGGTSTGDVVSMTAGGTADLTSVTKVETININNVVTTGNEATIVNLDQTAAEVDGTMLTINVNGSEAGDTVFVNATIVGENITFNGGLGADTVNSGAGNDMINGGGGSDVVFASLGNDTVNGGDGSDTIRGQAGNDLINGDAGDDFLIGDIIFSDAGSLAAYNAAAFGADTINGGIGNDTIVGGLGKDLLSGGDGADVFRYYSVEDSRFIQSAGAPVDARDVVDGFVAGTDKIDLQQLAAAAGQTIRFNGDFGTYAEAQAAVGSTAGDGFLDVAFVRNLGGQSVLFVDVDNNGQLDGNDLQIIMTNVTGTLTATDVNNPHLVTGPQMLDGSYAGEPAWSNAVVDDQYSAFRVGTIFESTHIA